MARSVDLLEDRLRDAFGVTEAARLVGVSPSTLRLWERQGLVAPTRSPGGARRYDRTAIDRLRSIARLRREAGWNAAAIRGALDGEVPEAHADGPAAASPARRLQAAGREPSGAPIGPSSAQDSGTAAGPPATNGQRAAGRDLGTRLRALRQRRRLTLREVAVRSGLSISFLSAVERGLSGISVAALRRTLAACDATLAELRAEWTSAGDLGSTTRQRLIRPAERRITETEGGVRIEDLAIEATLLEPQLFVLAPGATSDGTYNHPGEEFMFVLEGRVGVWIAETEYYELGPGDALTYPSTLLHRFACLGGGEARLLWVNTPPSF